jgi:hypothetical protein
MAAVTSCACKRSMTPLVLYIYDIVRLVIGNSSYRLNLDHLYEEMWDCGKLQYIFQVT